MRTTSSDIPYARQILSDALKGKAPLRKSIRRALNQMTRRTPDFRAPRVHKPLTREQKVEARGLRRRGWSILDIANYLRTGIGRVSEAVNGYRHKRRGHSRRVTF